MFIDLSLSVQITLILSLAGILAGIFSGVLGLGGGLVIVPAVYYILQNMADYHEEVTNFQTSVGTSLAVIFITSLCSFLGHILAGNVHYVIFKRWILPLVMGSCVGIFMLFKLPVVYFKLLFIALALFALGKMLLKSIYKSNVRNEQAEETLPSWSILSVVGFLVAMISASVGVGGGGLSTPFLSFYNVKIKRAIGVSSGVTLIVSSVSLIIISYFGSQHVVTNGHGYINMYMFFSIVPFSIFSAFLGVIYLKMIPDIYVKILFTISMLLAVLSMGINII